MKSKIRIPKFITVEIFTVITIFMWIIFEVYRTLTIKPLPNVPPEILEPLTPALDQKALDKIEKRVFISEENL